MLFFIMVFAAFCASSLCEDLPVLGIVGGVSVDIKFFPYNVAIINDKDQLNCGGFLVKPDTVITAGHCFYNTDLKTFLFRVGSTKWQKGGQVARGRDVIIHPEYVHGRFYNDIAIVKLDKPFELNEKVGTIKLATGEVPTGEKALVTGWGALSFETALEKPSNLQYADAIIYDRKLCFNSYGLSLTEDMFCAGHFNGKRGTCHGDSGGPLAYNNEIIGIVSFGPKCALEKWPGVYTYVSHYVDWVKSHVDL